MQKAAEANTPPAAPLPPLSADLPADVRQFLAEARAAEGELQLIAERWKSAAPEQRRDALRAWHEQHTAWLAAQKARGDAVAARVEAQIAEQPHVVVIPANASPNLQKMLTLQADIDDALAAVTDALKGASPERLRDAVRDWHDGHRAELQQLQKLQEKLLEEPTE